MNTSPSSPVASLMSRPLVTIDHGATLRVAAEVMAADCIGALVVRHGASLVGVLTERDVVAHVALGADLEHLTVGEVMQGDVVTTPGDASVSTAARTMVEADVRHLPVRVDDEIRGMVSVRDIMAVLTGTPSRLRDKVVLPA